jgi:cytoskeleton protein RodZ
MAEHLDFEEEPPEAGGIGAELKAAREARELTLEQIAVETRIPQRHLQTIEAGNFAALPARTYAIGFTRTYAKAVGLDDVDVANRVRAELDAQDAGPRHRAPGFEPGDPARVPSRTLGWIMALAVVLVLAGLFAVFRPYFSPAAELPSLIEQREAEQAEQAAAQQQSSRPPAAPAANASGPVVFTATDEAWVRFYTPEGILSEMVMARGDSYTVPPNAAQPMLRTGRPDALQITVGGRQVPRLSEQQQVVSDVPVTAQALIARGRPAAASTRPATTPTRAASPTR